MAAEGLCALRNYGVDPDVALEVINASSGSSLATSERLPKSVLTGKWDYGFQLKLMSKDCRIGAEIMKENFPKATLLPEVSRLANEAEAMLPNGDYTEMCKLMEKNSGTNLQVNRKTGMATFTAPKVTPSTGVNFFEMHANSLATQSMKQFR